MPNIKAEEIYALAQIAGLEIGEDRADTIAARLGSVLESIEEIPADALASVEPALTFAPYEAADE